ncbi:hypothetical protein [Fusibacter ferrireducens]|uniref:Flagellar protein FliT n=1 Tax=Fusibacter ferrireducens TaxID=2785058 RepID=A0ABR9ZVK3_9FIRM|nr:hypothetical protein [Fusibacter ferrireducens]MBF4694498.1 hypothetical protein [Fusibacter ferrireducens]
MKKEMILKKIMDETYIMYSSLKADDFDVMQNALEKREELIKLFEESNEVYDRDNQAFIDKFDKLNSECMKLLEQMKDRFEMEIYKTKSDKNKMIQMQKVNHKYQRGYESVSRSTFDLRK